MASALLLASASWCAPRSQHVLWYHSPSRKTAGTVNLLFSERSGAAQARCPGASRILFALVTTRLERVESFNTHGGEPADRPMEEEPIMLLARFRFQLTVSANLWR